MHIFLPREIKFKRKHRRVLRKLVIDDNAPGTILHDFEAMLTFLQEQQLPVTGMHQLPLRTLPEINARLARPLVLGLQRPQQKSYPHIHGLYLLVRASGLTLVDTAPKKPLLVVDDAVYPLWQGLNPTERYGTLLETWLLRGHPEIIGEDRRGWRRIPEIFWDWADMCVRVPDEGLRVVGDDETEKRLRYRPGWHNLGLLELFGLVTVQRGPPEPGRGWRIERLRSTPLGDALLALLYTGFFGDRDKILQFEKEERLSFGVLQPALQPYFPAWKNNLRIPEGDFRAGTYIFKVSLWRIWRRIAIPAELMLDDLASTILDAVAFDHDHLYRFSYQNRFGLWKHVNHPYFDDGPWTSRVRVGDLPLRVGQTMTFLFDFGDQWEFDVTLERVDPPDASVKGPAVLESHGEPPEQYPMW